LYLLGKPSTTNPYVSDQWNYLYFNNSNQKEIKKLVIYFKNEKVYKILVQNEIYKKLGLNIVEGSSLNKGPISIQMVKADEDIKPIILTLEDNTALE
jgi:outer membrane protein assembly factor BamE (lipoprotein component of BamABCDE complex)